MSTSGGAAGVQILVTSSPGRCVCRCKATFPAPHLRGGTQVFISFPFFRLFIYVSYIPLYGGGIQKTDQVFKNVRPKS